MEYIVYLTVLLLLGTLLSALAHRLKISRVFFLLFAGMMLAQFDLVAFDDSAIFTIATLALILTVFDSATNIRVKEFLQESKDVIILTLTFLTLNAIILGTLFVAYTKLSFILALIFSILMYGIDPLTVLSMLGKVKNRVIEMLEIEAILNTPLTIVLPLLFLSVLSKKGGFTVLSVSSTFFLLVYQLIIGVAIGLFIGFGIDYVLKKNYFGKLSYLALLTSATLAYAVSEIFDASGVIAITVFGLYFGNSALEEKPELERYMEIFSNILGILVFILLGTIIQIEKQYIVMGILLFLAHLCIRFLSTFSLRWLTLRDRVFLALNVPKGIDVAVVILLIITTYSKLEGLIIIQHLALQFVLYSVILSTFVNAVYKVDDI